MGLSQTEYETFGYWAYLNKFNLYAYHPHYSTLDPVLISSFQCSLHAYLVGFIASDSASLVCLCFGRTSLAYRLTCCLGFATPCLVAPPSWKKVILFSSELWSHLDYLDDSLASSVTRWGLLASSPCSSIVPSALRMTLWILQIRMCQSEPFRQATATTYLQVFCWMYLVSLNLEVV